MLLTLALRLQPHSVHFIPWILTVRLSLTTLYTPVFSAKGHRAHTSALLYATFSTSSFGNARLVNPAIMFPKLILCLFFSIPSLMSKLWYEFLFNLSYASSCYFFCTYHSVPRLLINACFSSSVSRSNPAIASSVS